ncbi:MAG: tyrosine-type recombinase/integrase, partial [Bryobacteraceae bacterium]
IRNYKRTLLFLHIGVATRRLETVDKITPDVIDSFRASRGISALTWTKELEILRRFFRFCVSRKWIGENPAAAVAMPKNIKPTDKEPYCKNDIIKILAACDLFGQRAYERLRARAMTLLLRYTALRISDVALLAKDRIANGEVYLRTMKNGKVVKLPVHPELQAALDVLPEPKGSTREGKYFFWSGNGTVRSMVRDATRTMAAVFKASGVPGAHAHRFRHTLATQILEAGGTFEDAAEVLGNSPNIIKKHYAKWSPRRQERISALMDSIFGTSVAREEFEAANDGK